MDIGLPVRYWQFVDAALDNSESIYRECSDEELADLLFEIRSKVASACSFGGEWLAAKEEIAVRLHVRECEMIVRELKTWTQWERDEVIHSTVRRLQTALDAHAG